MSNKEDWQALLDAQLHEQIWFAFDAIHRETKFMARRHPEIATITKVALDEYSLIENLIDTMWASLTKAHKQTIHNHLKDLMCVRSALRGALDTNTGDKDHRIYVNKLIERSVTIFQGLANLIHTLYDQCRVDVTEYVKMLDDTLNLSRFRYRPYA